jgi:hypothetical protein
MGGDMAASYPGYGWLVTLARRGNWWELGRAIQLQARRRGMSAVTLFRQEVLRSWLPRLATWQAQWRGRVPVPAPKLIHPDLAARIGLTERLRAVQRDRPQLVNDPDQRRLTMALANSGNFGSGETWMQQHEGSLEWPQPLMDRRLWEWCFRLSEGVFISDGMPRGLYRRALADVLPPKLLQRTSKGAFAPDLRERLLLNVPAINTFLAEHPPSDALWQFIHRPVVEQFLQELTAPPGRFPVVMQAQQLIQGLRLAHFLSWLRRA